MTPGEWPVSPDERLVDSVGNSQMSRREADALLAVIGTTVVAVTATGIKIGIDAATNEHYPPGETKIETVADVRPTRGTVPRPCFVFGGLGRQRARDIAQTYADAVRGLPSAPTKIGGFSYPNQGISDIENGACMDDFADGYDSFDIVGHSMGYLSGLRAALRTRVPRHIDTITAFSSPTDIDDVYKKREVEIVVRLGLQGDIGQKALFNLITDHTSARRDFFTRWYDIAKRSWHNAQTGVSPAVYVDQLRDVYYERAVLLMAQLAARGMITTDTKVRYCKTLQDVTVIANQACNSCEHASAEVDAGFSAIQFAGGHADVRAACDEMKRQGVL